MAEIAVGIVGTGFIGSHFAMSLDRHQAFRARRVLTRRDLGSVLGFPDEVLTNSVDDLVSNVDVIVECSGDPTWAFQVVDSAVDKGVPVVTMDTEFHITCGSDFVGRGLVTEAEGDQPGSLAALHEDAIQMGFEPVAYGNLKGFLNRDPTESDMEYWAEKQGFTIPKVTSFTDGTKVQAEQILVANFFGASIAKEGMLGHEVESIEEGSRILAEQAERIGRPISDFVVNRSFPHGVFLVATHDARQAIPLQNIKMGPGPYYTLLKHDTFVHLEILKTVRRVLDRGVALLHNSARPRLSLAAVAKRDLESGQQIPNGFGSLDIRGHAVRIEDHPEHVPLGLLASATIERPLRRGELLTFEHASFPESGALTAWKRSHVGESGVREE